jgi:hypothetical protein
MNNKSYLDFNYQIIKQLGAFQTFKFDYHI